MDRSRFNFLLDPEEDENLAVAAAQIPEVAPVEAPAPAVIPPSAPVAQDDAEPQDPLALVRAKLREKLFADNMAAMKPKAPTEIKDRLFSDLARAGSQMGAAIAGTKADTSFSDTMDKRSAEDALRQDKVNADETHFNQKLGIELMHPDKAKVDKNAYDPAKADRNSAIWKAIAAEYKAADPVRFAALEAEYKANGKDIDWNYVSTKPSQMMAQGGADLRNDKNNRTKIMLQINTFGHDDRKRAEEFARKIFGKDYDQRLQLEDEQRKSNLVQRGFLDANNPPNPEFAKKMANADIESGRIEMYANKLNELVKADVARGLNPMDNANIGQIYGLLRDSYRTWAQFGVPSGKDMEMIRDVVADPRDVSAFVKNFTQPGYYDAALRSIKDANEFAAQQYGYGPRGTGSISQPGATGPTKNELYEAGVKTRFGNQTPPADKPAPAPQASTKVSFDLNGKTVSVPPEKAEEFQKMYPKAVRK